MGCESHDSVEREKKSVEVQASNVIDPLIENKAPDTRATFPLLIILTTGIRIVVSPAGSRPSISFLLMIIVGRVVAVREGTSASL